jgi:hypothetical protein
MAEKPNEIDELLTSWYAGQQEPDYLIEAPPAQVPWWLKVARSISGMVPGAAPLPVAALKGLGPAAELLHNEQTYDPTWRAEMLPVGQFEDGSYGPALPRLIAGTGEAMDAFGKAGRLAFDPENTAGYTEEEVMPTPQRVMDLTSWIGPGALLGSRPAGSVGMFAGRTAKTADQVALRKAEEMAANGTPREQIWHETGWFQGADDQWRFEIPDQGMRVTGLKEWFPEKQPGEPAMAPRFGEGYDMRADALGAEPRVADMFAHDLLDAAYPERLMDMPLGAFNDPTVRGAVGITPDGRKMVALNEMLTPPDAKSTALHELQHLIQEKEGFSLGTTADAQARNAPLSQNSILKQMRESYAKRLFDDPEFVRSGEAKAEWERILRLEKDAAESDGYQAYRNAPGEVEARNVQARQSFTADQRKALPPWKAPDGTTLFSNPDDLPMTGAALAMDAGSREARATELGFHPEVWHHGTTKKFKAFDDPTDWRNQATPDNPLGRYETDGYHGAGIYMTSDPRDAGMNYHSGGPDITERVERAEEFLVNDQMPGHQARLAARNLIGRSDRTLELRHRAENPVHVGGDTDTWLGSNRAYAQEADDGTWQVVDHDGNVLGKYADEAEAYEHADSIPPTGPLSTIIRHIERNVEDWGPRGIPEELMIAEFEGGMPASRLEGLFRNARIHDDDVRFGQILQDAYRAAGYDAVQLNNPAERFPGMGLGRDTKHLTMWEPNKLRDKNARFDPKKKDSANLLFANRDPLSGTAVASTLGHGSSEVLPGSAGRDLGAGPPAGGAAEPGGVPGDRRGLAAPGRADDPYAPIPGIPTQAKIPGHGVVETVPVPWLVDAATDYMRSLGRPHELPEAFGPIDPERAARIAQAYEEMRHNPTDPAVRRSYEALADETLAQYKQLKDAGVEFRFNEGGVDPYAASPAMGFPEMRDQRTLAIFPTAEGYGPGSFDASEIANNPLLKNSGEKFGDDPATINDLFRAVHDSFGHYTYGNPYFRAPGEERAWMLHSGMYSPEARGAMSTELRGQNNWLNYGPHGEKNRTASAADTVFAEQKIGLMPEWAIEEGREGLTLAQYSMLQKALALAKRMKDRAFGGKVDADPPREPVGGHFGSPIHQDILDVQEQAERLKKAYPDWEWPDIEPLRPKDD